MKEIAAPSTLITQHQPSLFKTTGHLKSIDDALNLHLSVHVKQKIDQELSSVWAKLSTYFKSINFCDSEQVPDHLILQQYTLCAFVALSVGCLSGSTVRSRISAHIAHNVDWKGSSPLVKYVLKGVNVLTLGSHLESQSTRLFNSTR